MKKFILIVSCLLLLFSCKKENIEYDKKVTDLILQNISLQTEAMNRESYFPIQIKEQQFSQSVENSLHNIYRTKEDCQWMVAYMITGNIHNDDRAKFIKQLSSDSSILNLYTNFKHAIIATWYTLNNNQKQEYITVLDNAILFFESYDINQAETYYKSVIKYQKETKEKYNLPEHWQHIDLCIKIERDSILGNYGAYNYLGKRSLSGKFESQLERLIFKHKVMTPDRILYWLRFFKKELLSF
jgi:hypothetical protein